MAGDYFITEKCPTPNHFFFSCRAYNDVISIQTFTRQGADMDKYLNTGIKPIIETFPGIETILNDYGIGCAPCNVGTCLLKDIVEIHNLSPEDEQQLMIRIAGVVYPGKKIDSPLKKRAVRKAGDITYSPPMKKLVDEHVLIKRLVALIPVVIKSLDINSEEHRQRILDVVDFIRSYADKYHHAKEEDILFKYFDEDLDILKVMHEDHENARAHVRAVLEALDKRDGAAVVEHLNGYFGILPDHIKREDEILYPWMDRNLTTHDVGDLFTKFADVDRQNDTVQKKYQTFVEKLETTLQQ